MKMFFVKKYILAVLIFVLTALLGTLTLVYNENIIKYDARKIFDSGSKYESLTGKIENIGVNNKIIDDAIRKNIFGKHELVELYGGIQRLILKSEMQNFTFLKDNRGYVYNGAFYVDKDENIFEYARRIGRLKEYMEEKQGRALFVSYPEKSWIAKDYESGLPIRNYGYVQDELLAGIMKNRGDYLDLRTAFDKMGVDKEHIYYKTDRRMTTYGSFKVFQAIVAEIDRRYGVDLDSDGTYTEIYNYSVEVYPDIFLGDMATDSGRLFFGTDDLEIYNSETKEEFIWHYIDDKGRSFVKSGNKNVLLEKHYIESNKLSDNMYGNDLMKVFLNKYNQWDKIVNVKNPDGPRILCVRDESFSQVAMFLAPLCSEIQLISPATGDIDVEDYLEENDFDYVLVAFTAGHISDHYFDFFES